MNSGKVVVFEHRWLNSGKSCCIQESGCIPAKVDLFGQNWLYSDKVVNFGEKCFYSGKSCYFRAKWL